MVSVVLVINAVHWLIVFLWFHFSASSSLKRKIHVRQVILSVIYSINLVEINTVW